MPLLNIMLCVCYINTVFLEGTLRLSGFSQDRENTHPLCFETMKAVCSHSATNNSSVDALFCTFFSVMLYLLQGY